MPERPRKLLDAVRETIRLKHYSPRTEEAYVHWITRFVRFHNKRHPREMGAAEIEAFLTHLAVDQHVAASTQNQALSAILFLYRYVLLSPRHLSAHGQTALRLRPAPAGMPATARQRR